MRSTNIRTLNTQADDHSREYSYIMKGMAIICIMLHNYCHLMPGATQENEFIFSYENINLLFGFDGSFVEWIYELFSFFGWYGVPVFMFLTGFGLVMKYERKDSAPFKKKEFIIRNFLKLFFLMLPGILAFSILCFCVTLYAGDINFTAIANYFFQLTMLPDLFCLWSPPNPGVYWYFGLTMEFYLIYALLIHRRPVWWMWALLVLSYLLQFIIDPESDYMEWCRHNASGWMSVLIMGIVYARHRDLISKKLFRACLIVSLLLIFPSMLNPIKWQFSILACVIIAMAIAGWSMHIPRWRSAWIWIGRLSPMLFVAHPFARLIMTKVFTPCISSLTPLITYLCLSFILAMGFRYVTKKTVGLTQPEY